ncbi:MAG: phosphoribosylformimino-5-aminoimidazole carboxamide ribotide isomerase [Lachnospiraceae bacterium]|nr:phosphoribosylformimino-5-aminoimidazole carboxamide ribotide isomerase [Lachnospiraceae bacterium]
MQFRPCIDIHNGQVKQIVGSSLNDFLDKTLENFVSVQDAAYYANYYREHNLFGGHVIILNAKESDYYEATKAQALNALRAFPRGLQIGGGINHDNAELFLDSGASHIIVTSYVFENGRINYDNLEKLVNLIGKEKIVLDLSCRKRKDVNDDYYIVTDRWQKYTDVLLSKNSLLELSKYCDEFLIHAVDVEGKSAGIDENLVEILGSYEGIPVTYAGGVHNFSDLEKLKKIGNNRINVTIGSALDLFGGPLKVTEIINFFDN